MLLNVLLHTLVEILSFFVLHPNPPQSFQFMFLIFLYNFIIYLYAKWGGRNLIVFYFILFFCWMKSITLIVYSISLNCCFHCHSHSKLHWFHCSLSSTTSNIFHIRQHLKTLNKILKSWNQDWAGHKICACYPSSLTLTSLSRRLPQQNSINAWREIYVVL